VLDRRRRQMVGGSALNDLEREFVGAKHDCYFPEKRRSLKDRARPKAGTADILGGSQFCTTSSMGLNAEPRLAELRNRNEAIVSAVIV